MNTQPTILFDGVCNFCNGAVNFVIKRDKQGVLKFAALQSNAGVQLLQQYNLPTTDMKSIVFIENGIAHTQSTAALKVCKYLGWAWPLCNVFILVPKFVRDGLYSWIAKNRYKWFGKNEFCRVPSQNEMERFIE